MLSGLRSRWIRPASCAAAIPRPAASSTSSTAGRVRGVVSHCRRVSPSTSAIAMNGWSVVGPDVVDGDHVRMRQPGERLRLAPQPLAPLGPALQHLDRDRAAELGIARAVDHAHPAPAQHRPRSRSDGCGPPPTAGGAGAPRPRRARASDSAFARSTASVLAIGSATDLGGAGSEQHVERGVARRAPGRVVCDLRSPFQRQDAGCHGDQRLRPRAIHAT